MVCEDPPSSRPPSTTVATVVTVVTVVVDAAHAGRRADAVVAAHLPEISRRVARALARAGALQIDGRTDAGATRVRAGMVLRLTLAAAPHADLIAPQVLYRDDNYLVVDKPSGVHTLRLRPSDPPTLVDMVALIAPECARASTETRDGGALHRLDQGTSGAVAFARNRQAWTAGRRAFGAGAEKLYVARTLLQPISAPSEREGVHTTAEPPPALLAPELGVELEYAVRIDAALGASGPRGQTMRIDPSGQPAVTTVWRFAGNGGNWALVRLETGRRHQVRVHLAHLGTPIAGDERYGAAGVPPSPRLMLHAWQLAWQDPSPPLPRVTAPIPPLLLEQP